MKLEDNHFRQSIKKTRKRPTIDVKLKEQFDTLFETVAPKNKSAKSLEERISCLKKDFSEINKYINVRYSQPNSSEVILIG